MTPAGGESVTEGTILEWAVKVGDAVDDGQTSWRSPPTRSTWSCPRPPRGTSTEILAAGGRHGHRRPGHRAAAHRRGRGPPPGATAPEARRRPPPRPAAPTARPRCPTAPKVSPVAARIAAAEGVDLSRRHRAPARAGGSRSPTCSTAGQRRRGGRRRPRSRRSPSAAARRCSRATWTSRARSPRRPRSARSPSPPWTRAGAAAQGGRRARLVHPPDRLRDRAAPPRTTCR